METPNPTRRCGKKTISGKPCQKRPIIGATVCRLHGGAAPQVKRKAEQRIRDLVDPALTRLEKLIEDNYSSVALAAVKDVLDRAGYAARQRLEHTGADGGPIEFDNGMALSEAELDQYVIAIVERARARVDNPGQEPQPRLAPPTGSTNGRVPQ